MELLILDVWIFVQEVDISTEVLQPSEACDGILEVEIKQLIENG